MLPTTADIDLLDVKKPKAAGGTLVSSQAFFGLKLLLDIFNACVFVIMLVVGTMIASGVVSEARRLTSCIFRKLFRRVWSSIGLQHADHVAVLATFEKYLVLSIIWRETPLPVTARRTASAKAPTLNLCLHHGKTD